MTANELAAALKDLPGEAEVWADDGELTWAIAEAEMDERLGDIYLTRLV